MKGEEEQAAKIAMRFGGVVNAILSSGNGQSPETGFHVIHAGHEYVVMNFLQLAYGERETHWIEQNGCDCFTIDGDPSRRICFYVPYSLMNIPGNK